MKTKTQKPITRYLLQATYRPCDFILYWLNSDSVDFSPPYQRGDVWGNLRKINFIKSMLMRIPIPSIIVNDRWKAGWDEKYAIIDGKQRLTSLVDFFQDRLKVPAIWFDIAGGGDIVFSQLNAPEQRRFKNIPLAICEGSLKSIKEEKVVFELINFGGVPQGETD